MVHIAQQYINKVAKKVNRYAAKRNSKVSIRD